MVVAVSDPKVQMKRLRERDSHLSAEDAENRVKSQGDVKVKAQHALARGKKRGIVIWNDWDKEDLKKELARAMKEVQASSPQWWAYACLLCPPLGAATAAWNIWINWRAQKAWAEWTKKEKARL
jgi:dephospho-CoA kinase